MISNFAGPIFTDKQAWAVGIFLLLLAVFVLWQISAAFWDLIKAIRKKMLKR
jgi:hypothetical protein